MADSFRSVDIATRTQKKILSKMSNKTMVKVFLDEASCDLLDDVCRLAKVKAGCNKRDAEKFVKNIIKLVVKTGVVERSNQFSDTELKIADLLHHKLSSVIMSLVSFYEVDFSYNGHFLLGEIQQCRGLLQRLLKKHLTPKNFARIDIVFDFVSDSSFFDQMFRKDWEHRHLLRRIVGSIHRMIKEGLL